MNDDVKWNEVLVSRYANSGNLFDYYFNTNGQIKLVYTSVLGVALLLFTITGFWLWYGPKRMRINRVR